MKVTWSNGNLQVVAGDEIEVLRGLGERDRAQIEATRIHNITRGITALSSTEGVMMTRSPHDFTPPIHGYAINIEIRRNEITFDLEERAPPIISVILHECARFIDSELYERCSNKDYPDVVTNSFRILEDRIRAKGSIDVDYFGMKLIDHAFNPNKGVLTLGKTKAEREALNSLFRGAVGFLRNPPSHRLTKEEGDIEAFELISMIDLLLRIIDKSELRLQPLPEITTSAQFRKTGKEVSKESAEVLIERNRRRLKHSEKIKDEALKPWVNKTKEYCKIDSIYSKAEDKIIGVEPKDPTDLEFLDVAKNHLESKYATVLEAWEELKKFTSEYNKELASLLEEIRKITINELKMPCYYPRSPGKEPEERIMIVRFIKSIHREIQMRLHHKREWVFGKPQIEPLIHGDKKYFRLNWEDYSLVKSLEKDKVKNALSLITQLIEMPNFKEQVERLEKLREENYESKRKNFEMKIKDVIKSIELGNILEGKCRFCP